MNTKQLQKFGLPDLNHFVGIIQNYFYDNSFNATCDFFGPFWSIGAVKQNIHNLRGDLILLIRFNTNQLIIRNKPQKTSLAEHGSEILYNQ